eukprot:GHVU01061700.1.p2 GENE.GHVU01061700.1~~GHVU01061700.1.p2  ORF type:complete len:232 (+),score=25.37 GHVU01061700.1:24-719(+)
MFPRVSLCLLAVPARACVRACLCVRLGVSRHRGDACERVVPLRAPARIGGSSPRAPRPGETGVRDARAWVTRRCLCTIYRRLVNPPYSFPYISATPVVSQYSRGHHKGKHGSSSGGSGDAYAGGSSADPKTTAAHSKLEGASTGQMGAAETFIMLGTDGVWDFISTDEVAAEMREAKSPSDACQRVVAQVLSVAARESGVADVSLIPHRKRRSHFDDTTVVVIRLDDKLLS